MKRGYDFYVVVKMLCIRWFTIVGTPRNTVIVCILINLMSTAFVGLLIAFSARRSPYLQFGPNESLFFLGTAVDTWWLYGLLLILIVFIQLTSVVYTELASPVIYFNVYNPNVKHVSRFSKNQLHLLANTGYTISAVKGVLSILLSVAQIDIALWNVLVFEFFCVFTVRWLLNKKTFGADAGAGEEDMTNSNDEIELQSMDGSLSNQSIV